MNGGGIKAGGTVTLNLAGATLSGNDAANLGGGAAVSDSAIANVNGAKFFGNDASYGGGLAATSSGNLTITKSLFSGNVAIDDGAGVYASMAGSGSVLIQASKLTGNSSTNGRGGAAYLNVGMGATAKLIKTIVSQNSANKSGGGIFLAGVGDKTVNATSLLDNFSGMSGGGIFLAAGKLSLEKGIIAGNTATTMGGGIRNDTMTPLVVNGTKILNNFAPAGLNVSGL